MWRWFCVAGLTLGGGLACAAGCPQPLRIGFSDSATPPGLMGQGTRFAEPPGWEVVAVRDAVRRLGCTAELLRLPSRRLSAALAQGRVDFALLYATTPERLQTQRFPLDAQGRPDLAWAPVFGNLALFGRAGTSPEPGWNGRRLDARWRVGVIAGSVQEAVARERGWQVEPVAALDTEVSMLQAGRFDLLLTTREALTPEQRAGLVEWAPPVARLPYFMPASPAFAERHPAWTRSFWNAFCQAVRRLEPEVRPVDCGTVPAMA
jgi:ABC-type amino acid transport substrate-binding protein